MGKAKRPLGRPGGKAPAPAPEALARRKSFDVTPALEPVTRPLRLWDPDRCRLAEAWADAGNLELAADLCDQMMADADVGSALGKRVRSVLRADLTFEPGRGRRRRAAAKALEAEEDWWAMAPEAELVQWACWGLLLGVSLAQLVFVKAKGTGRLLPRMRFWHPRTLRYDVVLRAWFVRTDNKGDLRLDDPTEAQNWIMLMPFGESRPWAAGLWRSLWPWHLLSVFAVEDWGEATGTGNIKVLTEQSSEGLVQGDPSSKTSALRRRLTEYIQEMGPRGVAGLPPGFDLKLLEASASSHAAYESQLDVARRQKAIAILGQDMTTTGKGSTYAAGSVGMDVFQGIISGDAEVYATVLHDRLLTRWARDNFGQEEVAPWPEWHTQPPEDVKARAEGLEALARSIKSWRDIGVRVDAQRLADDHEIPYVEGDADDPLADVREGKLYEYHIKYRTVTRNEVRRFLGLPPVPGPEGDEYLVEEAPPGAGPGASGEGGPPGSRPPGGGEPAGEGEGTAPRPPGASGEGGAALPRRRGKAAPKGEGEGEGPDGKALARGEALAAPGRGVEAAALEGLAYADAVTQAALRLAPATVAIVIDRVAEALAAPGYDEARERLLELVGDGAPPPEALHRLLGQVAAMGAAAGAYSGDQEDDAA